MAPELDMNWELCESVALTVSVSQVHNPIPDKDSAGNDTEAADDIISEWVTMPENVSYLSPLLRCIAMLHTAIAFSLMVAYYFLKVFTTACVSFGFKALIDILLLFTDDMI